ncbi:MAG: AAA family ATPase [Ktedonobacteraceae bacterium]
MNKEQFITEALCLPAAAIEYHISQHLATTYPDKALIEGDQGYFDVEAYAQAQLCTLVKKTVVYNQITTYWNAPEPVMYGGPMRPHMMRAFVHGMGMGVDMPQVEGTSDTEQETMDRVKNAWLEVQWEGKTLDVLIMNWGDGQCQSHHHWLLADSEALARHFFAAVCQWNMEIRGELLVFDNGVWHKDPHLFQDIKGATFANLILKGSLKQDIQDDLTQFFAARETYEEYGIPWKRGILFVGPPGNGKTHAVKALINSMEQPCLYVKSFRLAHGAPDDFAIRQVFDRARRSAPCVLVFEDLDAQLTPQNRSFFLNELDGFAANIGIVTLATTNHPERLDPAILDRPSRFDRKYPFDLPELAERKAYIAMWNATLKPQLRLSDEGIAKISDLTDTFSFAYLKELFLSSMMRWISKPQGETMEEIMIKQVSVLREQMISTNTLLVPEAADERSMPGMFGQMGMRFGRIQG